MAKKISETNVIAFDQPKRGRGRPKKVAPETARLVDDLNRGLSGPEVTADDLEPGQPAAFGHNGGLDAGIFLRWVQRLNQHEEKGDKLKLELKAWRTERKLLRKEAGGDQIVLGELDEALEDLKTEQVDLLAREERRRQYHEWLGIPLTVQGELPMASMNDAEADAKRWFARGDSDGRLGKVRQQPAGCPPEHIQDYLKGWDAGQALLLQNSPLTRAGFEGPAQPAAVPTGATAGADESILVLNEGAFLAGTILVDANLKTMLPEHQEAFGKAEMVVALFGTSRRILKETVDGELYLDTGEEDVDVTEPEAVEDGEVIAAAEEEAEQAAPSAAELA